MTGNKDARKILITGMPYSGKSYIAAYLKEKGENVVDADDIKRLGEWCDSRGNKVAFPSNASREWLATHYFLWDRDFLRAWLSQQKSPVYLFGLALNVLEVADLFDRAYYLDVSPEVLQKRFVQNERTNPMGHTAEQQAAILADLGGFAHIAKERGLIFVRADQSPEDIYKMVSFNAR